MILRREKFNYCPGNFYKYSKVKTWRWNGNFHLTIYWTKNRIESCIDIVDISLLDSESQGICNPIVTAKLIFTKLLISFYPSNVEIFLRIELKCSYIHSWSSNWTGSIFQTRQLERNFRSKDINNSWH